MTLAPVSLHGRCILLLALCCARSCAEVDDPRAEEFTHLVQKKFHLTSFSPPSGDSSRPRAGRPVPARAKGPDAASEDFVKFGLFGQADVPSAPLLPSKWNAPVELVVLLVPIVSMLSTFAAKGGGPCKTDENTQVEAKELRSRSFGGLALLCAFLSFFGFLAHFKVLIIDGVYKAHLAMPTLRVPAIHSMIALSWLISASVQVTTAVYGSQTDTDGWRVWHRRIGYVAAVLALVTASSGMLIDLIKNWQSLHIGGALQGLFIILNTIAGMAAVRRRDFIEHKVYMLLAVLWTANVGMTRVVAWFFRLIFGCPNGVLGSMFEVEVVACASMIVLATLGCICEGKKTRRIIFFDFLCLVFIIICDSASKVTDGIHCDGMRHFFGLS